MRYFFLLFILFINSCKTQQLQGQVSFILSGEDQKIFDEVQQHTFQYFWKGADSISGMARERIHLDGIIRKKIIW